MVCPLNLASNSSSSSSICSVTAQFLLQLRFQACLRQVDAAVGAFLLYQFVMSATLDHTPVLQHQDQVGVHHALDAVRDDEGGASLHQPAQRLADLRLGL